MPWESEVYDLPYGGPPGPWKMIGRTINTADVVDVPALTQRFRIPSRHAILHGAQIGVLLCNDPVFTALEARIYSDRNGSPGMLLRTSTNQWLKEEVLLAQADGVKWAGFSFNFLNLAAGTWYHLALVPTGYTGDYDSHVGWRVSYPDPQYPLNLELSAAKAALHHLDFGLVGALVGAET